VFGAQAESCLRYLTKGRRVIVKGHLHHSEWTVDGSRRQKLEVQAREITFLPRSPQSDGDEQVKPEPVAVGADDGEDIPF
jgi:single-stranded DNA-binding protein